MVLDIADREVIDDSDEAVTPEQLKQRIAEGKLVRKEARDESFRILQEDARASTELKKAQLDSTETIPVESWTLSLQLLLSSLVSLRTSWPLEGRLNPLSAMVTCLLLLLLPILTSTPP